MLKRLFDVVVSAFCLLLLLPLMLVSAVVVAITMGFPILFEQDRPGLNGRVFRMYKFRTMRNAFGADGKPLADAERMTRAGKLLRVTSIDEIPELINVLKGDMSLVGPRPLLAKYLDLYSPEQARRHEVRPGITGWAQVNGRNSISWEDKFRFDVWYVDHQSFLLDMKILWLTVLAVLKKEGISASGHVTIEEFTGSHPIIKKEETGH